MTPHLTTLLTALAFFAGLGVGCLYGHWRGWNDAMEEPE